MGCFNGCVGWGWQHGERVEGGNTLELIPYAKKAIGGMQA